MTHALLDGSPAIDAGAQIHIPNGVTTDQRGLDRIINSGTDEVDIGAYESGNAFELVVTTGVDEDDAVSDSTYFDQLSLREAIGLAESLPGEDEITFNPSLEVVDPLVAEVTLSLGELVINSDCFERKLKPLIYGILPRFAPT